MSDVCITLREVLDILRDIEEDDAREQPKYCMDIGTYVFLVSELDYDVSWLYACACLGTGNSLIAGICSSTISKVKKAIEIVENNSQIDYYTRRTIIDMLKKLAVSLVEICKDHVQEGTLRELKRLVKQLSELE